MKYEKIDKVKEHSLAKLFGRIFPKFNGLITTKVCAELNIKEHEFAEILTKKQC